MNEWMNEWANFFFHLVWMGNQKINKKNGKNETNLEQLDCSFRYNNDLLIFVVTCPCLWLFHFLLCWFFHLIVPYFSNCPLFSLSTFSRRVHTCTHFCRTIVLLFCCWEMKKKKTPGNSLHQICVTLTIGVDAYDSGIRSNLFRFMN